MQGSPVGNQFLVVIRQGQPAEANDVADLGRQQAVGVVPLEIRRDRLQLPEGLVASGRRARGGGGHPCCRGRLIRRHGRRGNRLRRKHPHRDLALLEQRSQGRSRHDGLAFGDVGNGFRQSLPSRGGSRQVEEVVFQELERRRLHDQVELSG